MLELNKLYNMDCMEGMKTFPDKYFDLAIVDPPYGIGIEQSGTMFKKFEKHGWDIKKPDSKYWDELFRISLNQIIWGFNYFNEYLGNTKCLIFWDKLNGNNMMASGELAWTSFNKHVAKFTMHHFSSGYDNKIHPTQKPSQLYKWILHKYANPDFKIIDTHAGSCSSVVAFLDYGCDWIAFEIDKDYYKAASKRIENHKAQYRFDYGQL